MNTTRIYTVLRFVWILLESSTKIERIVYIYNRYYTRNQGEETQNENESESENDSQREKDYADATYEYASSINGSSDNNKASPNHECAICMESFQNGDEVRWLGCCHIFHKACIMEWTRQRSKCPVCRKPC